ncbi:MAG: 2,5-diamino-6-(ribosylamino)-4(3H)-pyrimidinone 5'-phosphate reductase [Thermoproteota archaeon]|nr:2,5-diamino-6-(ribosylamino)-4(3H)-pyrimidinone 5'-phosphate reductase [Thermoproteota archaeon]
MHVILNAAMSVDGKIATRSGDSSISSIVDLKRVHRLRTTVDAIMIGIQTVLTDDPMLDVRFAKTNRKNPARIIIDSTARIPLRSRILKTANEIQTVVAVTTKASTAKIHKIESRGAQVLVAGDKIVNIRSVFRHLERLGFKRILVEGGGEINWSVLNLGMIDEMIVMVSSVVIGGRDAKTLVEGRGFSKISNTMKMKLSKVERQTLNELVLYYQLF